MLFSGGGQGAGTACHPFSPPGQGALVPPWASVGSQALGRFLFPFAAAAVLLLAIVGHVGRYGARWFVCGAAAARRLVTPRCATL